MFVRLSLLLLTVCRFILPVCRIIFRQCLPDYLAWRIVILTKIRAAIRQTLLVFLISCCTTFNFETLLVHIWAPNWEEMSVFSLRAMVGILMWSWPRNIYVLMSTLNCEKDSLLGQTVLVKTSQIFPSFRQYFILIEEVNFVYPPNLFMGTVNLFEASFHGEMF